MKLAHFALIKKTTVFYAQKSSKEQFKLQQCQSLIKQIFK